MSIHKIKEGKYLQVRWRGPKGKQHTKMFPNSPEGRRAAEKLESEIKFRKAMLKKAARETACLEKNHPRNNAIHSDHEESHEITLPMELAAHLEWFKEAALFVATKGDKQFVVRFDLLHADKNELYLLGIPTTLEPYFRPYRYQVKRSAE